MFLLICKLYICIQNVFGHIFYRSRLHLYCQFWQFEVQKLAYMLILAAGGSIPYLSSVGGGTGVKGLMTKYPLLTEILGKARVTLIVPGCQPGWEEMEHFRGNLGENNSEKSQPGRKPHN